jgi:hypothetical protein
LYAVGFLSLAHGAVHIIQVVQSFYLASMPLVDNSRLEAFLESPIVAILWALVGILAIYTAYTDHKRHEAQDAYVRELELKLKKSKR